MWALSVTVYAGCKWLTWRRTQAHGVSWCRHVGYLLAWPGLDAPAFLSTAPRGPHTGPPLSQWVFAATKTAIGLALVLAAAGAVTPRHPYLTGWVAMVGIVFSLHFGVFDLLSCAWRAGGVDAEPLMNWPIAARSIADFWSARWNTAFRDLTHRFLFRPLTRKIGPRTAVFVGFLLSGLVHDLVISVPAEGGYGGPTIFFTYQGIAIIASRSSLGKRLTLRRGATGWLFMIVSLIAPAYLLFHPPFVERVVLPFMQSIGALP